MKIQIRPRGLTLSRRQSLRLESAVALALGKFADRIVHVIVSVSEGDVPGLVLCAIVVGLESRILKVESSDTSVSLSSKHAIQRVARSVSRAIEIEAMLRL